MQESDDQGFELTLAQSDDRVLNANQIASKLLGRRLAHAIACGYERDVGTVDPVASETERPLSVLALIPPPSEQIPQVPARATHIAFRLAQARRREFAEDLAIRNAEAAAAHPGRAQGEYTLLELRYDTCHYALSERPYLFCGAAVKEDRPYCAEHAALCYESQR